MESLRLLKEEVALPPFSASRKIFLIFEAERMLPTSANALLKTFEEPSAHSIIILVSSFSEKLFLPCSRAAIRSTLKAQARPNSL